MLEKKVFVAISGLPGKMARLVANGLVDGGKYHLATVGLTGPSDPSYRMDIRGQVINLFQPREREKFLDGLSEARAFGCPVVVIDFSHPSAVNDNGDFYCRQRLPFVMGTTGGDRDVLKQKVEAWEICAVIAPNMAAPVVALQAMIQYGAENFPDCFSGFRLQIVESHQKAKPDSSGTARAMIPHFRALGLPFEESQIVMIRDEEQQLSMGVPAEHLGGHGWHSYSISKPDDSMKVEFVHNINGRAPYVDGTMKALDFLVRQVRLGVKGKVFSMIDVLKG